MTAAAATGGTYLRNPTSERVLGGNLMTVHPLGGCSMGGDRGSGVVNHKGQVFDAIQRRRSQRRPHAVSTFVTVPSFLARSASTRC